MAFKIVNEKGDILKRFQVSFISETTYGDCCRCVEEKLMISVNHLVASTANENSQIIDYCSQAIPRSLQNPIHTETQQNVISNHPFHQSQSLNRASQYVLVHEQQAPAQKSGIQTQLFELPADHRVPFHLNTQNGLCPHHSLSTYCNQLQSNYSNFIPNQPNCIDNNLNRDKKKALDYLQRSGRDIATINNPSNFSSSLGQPLIQGTIQSDHINQKKSVSDTDYKTNCSIGKQENCIKYCIKQEEVLQLLDSEELDSRKHPTKDSTKNSQGLQKSKQKGNLHIMKDSQLKRLIKERLKDKEFITFVKKLEKIVSQP